MGLHIGLTWVCTWVAVSDDGYDDDYIPELRSDPGDEDYLSDEETLYMTPWYLSKATMQP
eukprot:1192124-Prorocentrum_minimum.AAC.2